MALPSSSPSASTIPTSRRSSLGLSTLGALSVDYTSWRRCAFVFTSRFELGLLFIISLSRIKTVWSTAAFDLGRNMAVGMAVRVCGSGYGKRSDGEQKYRKTYVLPDASDRFTNDTVVVMIVSACLFILGYAMTWARK